MTVHNFRESLERSHAHSDATWWLEIYRQAFPGLASAVNVRQDGWAQRGGIDRILTLSTGRVIYVDEKVREKDYGDILLERWSDEAAKSPGWVQKPLACEFIAYAIAPSSTCYLLPVLTLQRAWRLHGLDWINAYPEKRANNGRYVTISHAIPVSVLMGALADAICVEWREPKYDPQDDFAKSLDVGYAAIRDRVAAGGPGWEPK